MNKIIIFFTLIFLSFNTFAKNPKVLMKTNHGDIEIELLKDKAPITVANFLKYVKNKEYNKTIFHRVIDNFMIQGGGFTTELKKKKTLPPIKNEAGNMLSNDIGTVAMARTGVVDSATNQFFINVNNNTFLNHTSNTPQGYGYAVFGKITKGMTVVNQIKKVKVGKKGQFKNMPINQVIIKSISKI